MSKFKFTPGPWVKKASASWEPDYCFHIEKNGDGIAEVYEKPNADLIVQAPALVRACILCLNILDNFKQRYPGSQIIANAVQETEAVLAKVRGE